MKKLLYIALFLVGFTAKAQFDYTLYNMDYIPQVQFTNPSSMPKYGGYYQGFLLPTPGTSFGASLSHTGFTWNHLVNVTPGDSVLLDIPFAVKKMSKRNYITNSADVTLFELGFKARETYLSFAVRGRSFSRITYPGDLFKLIVEGNGTDENLGQRLSFDGLGVDHFSYGEFSTNIARNINDKITIGLRPKLLWGFTNVYTRKSQIGIETATQDSLYNISLDAQMEIQSSGIDFANADPTEQFTSDTKNWGFGLDLGTTFKPNDDLTFSVAVNDMGFIRWKFNTLSFHTDSMKFQFKGVDIVEPILLGQDTTNPFQELADSLQSSFNLDSTRNEIYSTPLPARIYLSGKYNLTENTSIGLLSSHTLNRGKYSLGLSLSVTQKVKNWLQASLNYSMYNRSVKNFGGGLSATLGPIQFYAMSDNFMGFLGYKYSYGQEGDAILIGSRNYKNYHARFGFNMVFAKKPKDTDKDGIEDRKDECPTVKGLEQFNGCPDTDEDGIPDEKDNCPTNYGPEIYQGCPDSDQDKVIDKDDKCPTLAGLVELQGCPDLDRDGIADEDDDCPDMKGLEEFKGCPDLDKDGIPDKDDICPLVAGLPELKGCPQERLAIMNTKGDTLQIAALNEDKLFVFRNIDPLQDYDLFYIGKDTGLTPDLTIILLNEDHVMRLRTIQDDTIKKLYHYLCPKIQVVDENGKVVGVAVRGKDGKYVFKNLNPDHTYKFIAIGDEQRVPGDIDILLESEDGITEIRPIKDSSNVKVFNYKPLKADDTIRLNLLDENGNIVVTATMDDKGMFVFRNLDPDKTYTFSLEGSDPRLTDEVPIMYITDGGMELISAKLKEGKLYQYKKLEKIEEIKIELNDAEKAIIDKAFDNLEFETSLTIIKEHSLPSLNEMAKLVKEHKNWAIKITGYTDNVGSDEQNMELSERRAKAVEHYFAQEGVLPSHFIIEWYGETKPIADNSTPEGRQKNRRVELEIVEIK